jgi:hypothetical protein
MTTKPAPGARALLRAGLLASLALASCGEDEAAPTDLGADADDGGTDAAEVVEDTGPDEPEPAPILVRINPDEGPLAGGVQVGGEGEHFVTPTRVFFGDNEAGSVRIVDGSDGELLTMLVPAGDGPGPVDVRVETANGSFVLEDGFEYLPGTAPFVESIAPTVGDIAGGDEVAITGQNFPSNGARSVIFGGSAATALTPGDATYFTVTTPAGAYGTVDLTVNFDGVDIQFIEGAFTYTAALDLTGVIPAQAAAGAEVRLDGAGLTENVDLEIFFGDTLSPPARYVLSGDSAVVTVPEGSGLVTIRAVGDNGEATLIDGFEYE